MAKFKISQNLIWPLVILIIALVTIFTKPWQASPVQSISVTGTGKTQVTPNIAQITADITTYNKNLETARKINSQAATSVVTALENLGIEAKDIKTENVFAGPGYEPTITIAPVPPGPTTNQVTTSLAITIRDFEITDEVLAALTQNGAINFYGPNLTVADEKLEEAQTQARQKAVENARQKAEQLAKLSERKLGKVTKIQDQGDFIPPQPIFAQNEQDLLQKANQIQPGQNEITVNLQVEFELK